MPFSSLSDPADLARAYSVLDSIWEEIKSSIPTMERTKERTRLAYLVLECAPLALDEEDLRKSVMLHYRRPAAA